MNIVVDCRAFTKRATGIATYTIDAIRAICKNIPEWHLVLASPEPFHESIVGIPLDKVEVVIESKHGGSKIPRILWYHLHFPKIVKRFNADIVWSPIPETPFVPLGKIKRMITIHDVVNKEFRNTMLWKDRLVSFFLSDYAIKRADLLWCNSFYTKDKVNSFYAERKQKQIVVGDACSEMYRKKEISSFVRESIFKEYDITKGFILFVGTLEPRKNLSFLLKLMPSIYKETGYKLLVVGASGWKNSDVAQIVCSSTYPQNVVSFAKYVEQEKLIDLYNLASLYVSTAVNEGFGMPQLEAMTCGCPVVCPHNSGMIEVVKGRGLTIEGWDSKEWINKICQLLNNPQKLNEMKQPDLSDYSWPKIIKRVKEYVDENMAIPK